MLKCHTISLIIKLSANAEFKTESFKDEVSPISLLNYRLDQPNLGPEYKVNLTVRNWSCVLPITRCSISIKGSSSQGQLES